MWFQVLGVHRWDFECQGGLTWLSLSGGGTETSMVLWWWRRSAGRRLCQRVWQHFLHHCQGKASSQSALCLLLWWGTAASHLLLTVEFHLQGSGHMVPSDKPVAAFAMFSRFIKRQPYWCLKIYPHAAVFSFIQIYFLSLPASQHSFPVLPGNQIIVERIKPITAFTLAASVGN